MSSKKHTLAVVIGRFEPLHSSHLVLLRKAFHIAENVLVLIGSSHCSRNIKNPFSYKERSDMIKQSLSVEETKRLVTFPLVDNLYSDDAWLKEVQDNIKKALVAFQTWTDHGGDGSVVIVGNKKDESSYYLDMFPQYSFESIDEIKMGLDATTIRKIMFEDPEKLPLLQSLVSEYTYDFISKFLETPEYLRLQREYIKIRDYKASWSVAPYPPSFVTVDAVIKKAGHLAMIRRKYAPGEDLLAFAGGFVENHQTLHQAVFDEVTQETSIDLPPGLLQSCIAKAPSQVFDHPDSSLRGRTFKHVYLLDLDIYDRKPGFPKLKAGDDAKDALWLAFDDVFSTYREEVHEDHVSLGRVMLGI